MRSLKAKLLLFSLIPFLSGVIILSFISFYKTNTLLEGTLKSFEDSIIKEKQSLLKNELKSVKSLIENILSKNKDLEKARVEIIELLSGIRYLDDDSGYFFAYEKR